jgi:small-conductance mechanosensitive channel
MAPSISAQKTCDCEMKEKQLRAKERTLKQKESALKKQELELSEQTEQLVALKSLTSNMETKIRNLQDENRLLKLKLLASEDTPSHHHPPPNHTSSSIPNSQPGNHLTEMCTVMTSIALASLANAQKPSDPNNVLHNTVDTLANAVKHLTETVDEAKELAWRNNHHRSNPRYYPRANRHLDATRPRWTDDSHRRSPPRRTDDRRQDENRSRSPQIGRASCRERV